MTRLGPPALLALLLAPAAAGAQWRAEPMRVRLDPAATDVLAGPFAGAGAGPGLLVADRVSATAEVRPFHALLAPEAAPFPFPREDGASGFRSGRLAQAGADALADLARVSATGVQVAFGDAPGTLREYPLTLQPIPEPPPAFLHLLAREGDVLVFPYFPWSAAFGRVLLVDFDPSGAATVAAHLLDPVYLDAPVSLRFEAFPLRLSALARSAGIDDVAVPAFGGVLLVVHGGAAAPAALGDVQFVRPFIEVGGNHGGANPPPARPPWLPDTVRDRGDALGVAAVDIDLDGDLDLVFPQSFTADVVGGQLVQGELVWVQGTGNPADFGDYTVTLWHDLGLTLGLPDPLLVRQVEVGGEPAAAVWDRDLEEVVVVYPDGGTLATWRAPAPGRLATDIRLVDVVGSSAPDLVVVVDNGPLPPEVLVYPDSAGPALAWAAGSPGEAVRGIPHPMEVLLDPAGPITVDWIEGAPTSAPVSGLRLTRYEVPVSCASPPPDLSVLVRATDDTGVFTEIAATVPVSTAAGAIALRGAPGGALVLEPEGVTTAVFDAVAATACGTVSWGGAWPAGATVEDASGPGWLRRTVVLTDAAYPLLLADPSPAVSITTTDPAAAPPVVTLAYALDGSRLVELTHQADRATLAEGEIAVLRTRVRSRIGAALPGARILHALSGLAPAGPPSVTGAVAAAVERDGAEVVLDALPAAPAEVTIELPVRRAGSAGGSSVEVRSAGGWRLTPPAPGTGGAESLPGCGCGAGGGTGWLLVVLALAARRVRRAERIP